MIASLLPKIPLYWSFYRFGVPKLLPFSIVASVSFRCNSKCKTCDVWRKPNEELTLVQLVDWAETAIIDANWKRTMTSCIIDLQKSTSKIATPYDAPPAAWNAKQVGETFEIPQDIRVKVTEAKIISAREIKQNHPDLSVVKVLLDVENKGGYDLVAGQIGELRAFDDQGHVAPTFFLGTDRDSILVAPGQTKQMTKWVMLNRPLDQVGSAWFVICLRAYNKKLSETSKCEIYRVNK